MKKIFALVLLFYLAYIPQICLGSENAKFKKLFYPKGMPFEEGALGKGRTVYEYYSEAEIPGKNLLFVLYSEMIPSEDSYSDYQHTAYLATIKKTDKNLKIISTIDVTKYMTETMEECSGCFVGMGGDLDIVPLKDDKEVLHLGIGSTVSGTGGVNSSSDIFFLVGSNGILVPVLELLHTSWGGRGGFDAAEFSYTFIFTLRNEKTGTKILTRSYKYEYDLDKNIDKGEFSPDINVYQYDFTKNKYYMIKQIHKLPAGAKLNARDAARYNSFESGYSHENWKARKKEETPEEWRKKQKNQ